MDQVVDQCNVQASGRCIWHITTATLAEAWDVEDLEDDWEAVYEAIDQNDEPVIVSIANPNLNVDKVGDHAVVAWKIERSLESEFVVYMDPLKADHQRLEITEFIQWWHNPGSRAFLVRT